MRITLESKDVENALLDYLQNILNLPYEYHISWNDYVPSLRFDIVADEETVNEGSEDEDM